MNEQEIKAMIDAAPNIKDFISSDKGQLEVKYHGEPVIIFKEAVGCSYYFKFPYSQSVDYRSVKSFMRSCVKYIGKLLEQEREKNICVNPDPKHYFNN